jgi:transcriptional regulator with XRE-family HTH domain
MTGTREQKLMKAFGRRVAEVRKSRGVTQQELAERINMSVVAIAYIETGKDGRDLVHLAKSQKH